MEMKRLWICLLALLVLAGCGGNPTDVGVTLVVPQSAGSYSLNMETEWMEYDPSVDSIWCILSSEVPTSAISSTGWRRMASRSWVVYGWWPGMERRFLWR